MKGVDHKHTVKRMVILLIKECKYFPEVKPCPEEIVFVREALKHQVCLWPFKLYKNNILF